MAHHGEAYFLSDYFLSELSGRSEESPFLQHTGALAEILHFVQDDKKEKQDDRSDVQDGSDRGPRRGPIWVAMGETHGSGSPLSHRPWRGRTKKPHHGESVFYYRPRMTRFNTDQHGSIFCQQPVSAFTNSHYKHNPLTFWNSFLQTSDSSSCPHLFVKSTLPCEEPTFFYMEPCRAN